MTRHGTVRAVEQAVDLRQIEARHHEHAATRGEFVAQASQVLVFAEGRSRCVPIEGHQHPEQRVDVALPQFAVRDHPVEHPRLRQPLHRHQPVDGAPGSGQLILRGEREDAVVPLQRQQAEVDAWREPTVHAQLGAGVADRKSVV